MRARTLDFPAKAKDHAYISDPAASDASGQPSRVDFV